MATLSGRTQQIIQDALTDPGAATELATAAGSYTAPTPSAAITNVTVTYTANNPNIAANPAVVIADGSAPTNAELLNLCLQLRVEIIALNLVLHNQHITA